MNRNDRRRLAALLMTLLCPLGAVADPPFRDVLIDVPLDLTDLPNIISKVAVECELTIRNVTPPSPGSSHMIRTGRTEVSVVNGSVAQSVQVLVTVPSITRVVDPQYPNQTQYVCTLRGFLEEGLGWHDFVFASSQQIAANRLNGALREMALLHPNMPSSALSALPGELSDFLQWPATP